MDRASWIGLRATFVACSVIALGCGSAQPVPTIGSDETARTGTPEGWPEVLVAAPGDGPALFLGPENDSPAIGYVSQGVRVRVDGPVQNQRVPVTLAGELAARGWMPLSRLGAYVTERGRVEGTPAYLGVGDFVSLVGRRDDGSFDVQISPWFGRTENDRVGPWTGNLPAERLTATRPEQPDSGLNPGENRLVPANAAVEVYDRPGGRVIATIPGSSPPPTVVVLRDRDGWKGIRAGVGPFLVGYVQVDLTPAEGAPRASWSPPSREPGALPTRIAEEEGGLLRVREGTRVRFLDRVIARVRGTAWARRLGAAADDQVDVYVAADDGAALRGLVRQADVSDASEPGAGASDGEGL